jgi:hypothetical protein
LADEFFGREWPNSFKQMFMIDVIEATLDVRIDYPDFGFASGNAPDTMASWALRPGRNP